MNDFTHSPTNTAESTLIVRPTTTAVWISKFRRIAGTKPADRAEQTQNRGAVHRVFPGVWRGERDDPRDQIGNPMNVGDRAEI